MILLKNKNGDIREFNNISEIGMGFADWINITDTEEGKVYLLQKTKDKKINELNEFHNSDETRELTVKSGNRQTHINMKNDRALIDEQISNMDCRIKLGEANPIWVYKNQIEVPLNYKALALIKLKIAEIVDFNFNVRRNSLIFLNAIAQSKEKSIEKCIEEVKNFNFKKDYKINNSFELTL
jgi:anthranilate/para-aminobenzoate synthase component I